MKEIIDIFFVYKDAAGGGDDTRPFAEILKVRRGVQSYAVAALLQYG